VFYNVNRSSVPYALAGNFYLRDVGGNQKYVDALYSGVRLVRRAGGEPQYIVVNDEDFQQISFEMTAAGSQMTYFADANNASGTDISMAKGMSNLSLLFSTSWIKKIFDDPYCPKGTAYILTEDALRMLTLSNLETPINDGIAENAPGKQAVTGTGEPSTEFKLLMDDYLNVVPGAATVNGPATQISLQFYGNLAVTNASVCACVKFS
jgi:hypothetical protein